MISTCPDSSDGESIRHVCGCIYKHPKSDNIYGNNFTQEIFGGNILIKFADYFSQFLSIKKKVLKEKPKVVYKREYSSFVETDFIDDISNWNVKEYDDTNSKFNDFLWGELKAVLIAMLLSKG